MRKLFAPAFLLAVLAAGYAFFQRFEIEGLENLVVTPRAPASGTSDVLPAERESESIRIATWNIQVFGQSKLAQPGVMEIIVDVARRFDVLAIQEVRSKQQDVLPRLVEMINADGSHYDYVIGERLGRTSSKEQYAYVYDAASVEVDRATLYTIGDPNDQLHREPLVASFRVRGPPVEQAFTFTLVNIHTDPDEVKYEVDALDDVMRAVRDDGRGEDDILMLGDLNADERSLGELGRLPDLAAVVVGEPTNTRRTKTYDNILYFQRATTEFTGYRGVLDLEREYQLTLDQALEVSDHLPVWAAFSIYEGGQVGRVAAQPERPAR